MTQKKYATLSEFEKLSNERDQLYLPQNKCLLIREITRSNVNNKWANISRQNV